jgi:hypothetical protein
MPTILSIPVSRLADVLTEETTGLAPWADGPVSGRGAMFVATIRTEYHLASLTPVMGCRCP